MNELKELAGRHSIHPASDVKARWRSIVKEANDFGEVIVTNYDRPEVVVISLEQYAKLKTQAAANDPLKRLRAEWDRQLAWLRAPDAGQKLREIFASTPEQIADAANAAAGRRKG
jgi:prevent-host-death family protein